MIVLVFLVIMTKLFFLNNEKFLKIKKSKKSTLNVTFSDGFQTEYTGDLIIADNNVDFYYLECYSDIINVRKNVQYSIYDLNKKNRLDFSIPKRYVFKGMDETSLYYCNSKIIKKISLCNHKIKKINIETIEDENILFYNNNYKIEYKSGTTRVFYKKELILIKNSECSIFPKYFNGYLTFCINDILFCIKENKIQEIDLYKIDNTIKPTIWSRISNNTIILYYELIDDFDSKSFIAFQYDLINKKIVQKDSCSCPLLLNKP